MAIKVIGRDFWDEREDRALRGLRGVGGMLQMIDLVVTPLEVFVITPHYDRGDVLDGINRGGYGTLEQCRTLLYEIVLLVRRLHQHGFCHNDLKFENFLRRDDGGLVLIDFGLPGPIVGCPADFPACLVRNPIPPRKWAVGVTAGRPTCLVSVA